MKENDKFPLNRYILPTSAQGEFHISSVLLPIRIINIQQWVYGNTIYPDTKM